MTEQNYPFINLDGKLIESENDERMRRKHGYNYGSLKEIYPDVHKLPETEIMPMIDKLYEADEPMESTVNRVKSYIAEKEPEWKKTYLAEKPMSDPKQYINSSGSFVSGNPFNEINIEKFKEVNNRKTPVYETIMDSVFGWSPEYKTLKDAKFEMEAVNKKNYDNYAHRLGFCRIGQMGDVNPLSPYMGKFLGALKEGKDLFSKTFIENKPFVQNWEDTRKDWKNNIEALNYGLHHPDNDCRLWLENLDYKNNKWK